VDIFGKGRGNEIGVHNIVGNKIVYQIGGNGISGESILNELDISRAVTEVSLTGGMMGSVLAS